MTIYYYIGFFLIGFAIGWLRDRAVFRKLGMQCYKHGLTTATERIRQMSLHAANPTACAVLRDAAEVLERETKDLDL